MLNKLKRKIIEALGGVVQISSKENIKFIRQYYDSIPIRVAVQCNKDPYMDEEDIDRVIKQEMMQRIAEHMMENNLVKIHREPSDDRTCYYTGMIYVMKEK